MHHIEENLLQRYLAGEADRTEVKAVEDHLPVCADCTAAFETIAAEDAVLRETLDLDGTDLIWAMNLDISRPVLREIHGRREFFYTMLLSVLVLAPGVYALKAVTSFAGYLLLMRGPGPVAIELLRTMVPRLLDFAQFLIHGGVLPRLWPWLVMGLALWLWRRMKMKEANSYA